MTLLRGWFGVALWQRVMAGLALGVALGLAAPAAVPWVSFLGEIFVRLIRMLVVPIVLVTVAAGIASLSDFRRLGSIGGRAVLLFLATTVIAVSLGIVVGLIFQPGANVSLASATPHALGPAKTAYDTMMGIVPLNIFDALGRGDMLAILFVAVLLGAGTVAAGEAGAPLAALLDSASNVLLHIVRFAMEFTPFGVFALVAAAVAANGVAIFASIGILALCVVIGSLVQMLLVHSLLVRLVAHIPVSLFFRGIAGALIVAFSTASSSATLPVAMRVAQDNLGIARPVASMVLPLGASIGKDGTAMYVGLLSMFGLQLFGVPIDPATLGIVLFTAVLAALGTAPIPSASLFMLAAVLAAAGVTAEQTALIVGLILPFDRLLDMTRTVSSASANLAVTAVVAALGGKKGADDRSDP
ncbi:dicarboxylate/amino acid:cation symporter [Sphingomonas sp. ZT3P38]|uniref:dicarboxylate/amino acid:cation symporter n=1 Tax=Parasphingomonas zepuensis TaxID=3096161 RepID=UPI002FCA8D72